MGKPKNTLGLGLLLAVWVTVTSVSDNTGGIRLLTQISAPATRVAKAWADTGYRTKVIDQNSNQTTSPGRKLSAQEMDELPAEDKMGSDAGRPARRLVDTVTRDLHPPSNQ
ncbi:hypothetical protein [Streptomyces sp. NPDC048111]|uniref:hypothetical protein n=1 Tax=Streptomyces sp. NPDC048111 TaxID=3365500 RepID=UPI00370F92DB